MSTMGYVSTLEGATASASLSLDFEKQSYRVLEGGKQVNKGFDELLTFSRATTGGRFNEKGLYETVPANQPRFDYDPITKVLKGLLVEEQRTNLVTMSEQLGSWQNYLVTSKRAEIASPSGTLNATKVIPTTDPSWHQLRGNVFAVTASNNYTTSVFAKKGENDIVRVTLENATLFPSNSAGVFNLSTGTVVSGAGAKIQDVGDGWYRCSVTSLCAVTGTTITALGVGSSTYVGDGVSGLYFWGAQVEMGIFATSYIPTEATFTSRSTTATYYDSKGVLRTAGVNVPRTGAYLYDQSGVLQPVGLLLESASTNLARYSGLPQTGWSKFNVTISINSGLAPDGSLTASLFQNTPSRGSYIAQSFAGSATPYTISVYVKPYNNMPFSIGFEIINGDGGNITYDAVARTFTGNNVATKSYEDVGNGWVRVKISLPSNSRDSSVVYCSGFGANSVQHSGYIWGYQVEAGLTATSYIPSAVTFTSRSTTATYIDSNGLMQTAGINVARDVAYGYEGDSGILRPMNLLLEPSSANLLSYSQDYASGKWDNVGAGTTPLTITPNAANGTRGASTMTLIERKDLGGRYLSKIFTAGADTVITRTQRIKAVEGSSPSTWFTLRLQATYPNLVDAWFNPFTGEFSGRALGDCTFISASMTKEADGVWLCSLTGKSGADSWKSTGISVLDRVGSTDATPTALSSLYIDCAQLEIGPMVSSYIPTTTASVTRGADVSSSTASTRAADITSSVATTRAYDKAVIEDISSWYNPVEGTIVADFTPGVIYGGNYQAAVRFRVSDSESADVMSISRASETSCVASVTNSAGVQQFGTPYNLPLPNGTRLKASLGVKVNSGAFSPKGSTVQTDNTLVMPAPTMVAFGQTGANTQCINGYLHSIHYYPLRLSSPQLQIISE